MKSALIVAATCPHCDSPLSLDIRARQIKIKTTCPACTSRLVLLHKTKSPDPENLPTDDWIALPDWRASKDVVWIALGITLLLMLACISFYHFVSTSQDTRRRQVAAKTRHTKNLKLKKARINLPITFDPKK